MPKMRLDFVNISTGIFVPLLILGGIVFGYFSGRPQIKNLAENRVLLQNKQAEIFDRESSLTAIKNLIDQVEGKGEVLAVIDAALPASPAIPELLVNLEFLARESGLTLTDLGVEIPRDKEQQDEEDKPVGGDLGIVIVDISVSGRYPQLSAFLLNVEQNLRMFDVERIEFAKAGTSETTQAYTVVLKSYYQKIR